MSRKSNVYYIDPTSISITPNANGLANDLAVYIAQNTQIKVLARKVGIGYSWSAFRQWTFSGRNRRLADSTLPYTIYARLHKKNIYDGYLVFAPKHKQGEEWTDKYAYVERTGLVYPAGSTVSNDYWYIRLGDVTLPVDGKRAVTLDTGILGTDQYNMEWQEKADALPLRVELGCTINDEDAGQTPYVHWDENLLLTALLMKGWDSVDSARFHHWEISRNSGDAKGDAQWPSASRQLEFKKTGSFTLQHTRGNDDDFSGAMSAVFTITAWGFPKVVEASTPSSATVQYVQMASKSITILSESVEKYELALSSSVVSYSPQTDDYNPKNGVKVRIRAIDQRGDVNEISIAQLKRERLSVGFAPTDSNVWSPLVFNGGDTDVAEAIIGTAAFTGQKSLNVQLTRPIGALVADTPEAVAELARTTIAFVRDGEDSREREWVFIRSKTSIMFSDDPTGQYPLPALIEGGEVKPKGSATNIDANKNQEGWVPHGWNDEQQGVDSEWCYEYGAFRDYVRNGEASSTGESNPGHWGDFSTPRIWNHFGTDGGKPVSRYQWSKNANEPPHYETNSDNPGADWMIDVPARPEGQGWYLWTISAIKNADESYGTWGNPIRMTGDEGAPGTKTQRAYYKSDSDKAPDAPEGDVTSSLDTPGAWRTVALTADEYNRYVYICERISEDNGESWKAWGNVVLFCYRPNRNQIEDLIQSVGDERYIRKDIDDTVIGHITFEKGLSSNNIKSKGYSEASSGYRIWESEDGESHADIDFLNVRKKANFTELEIRKLSAVGGDLIVSPCSATITSVEKVANGFKCFFKSDDGTMATTNGFRAGDQAKCQTFNIKSGVYKGVSNRYYWRTVEEVGRDEQPYSVATNIPTGEVAITYDEGKADVSYDLTSGELTVTDNRDKTSLDYIILSDTSKDAVGTDEPKAGDVIVLCGQNEAWCKAHNVPIDKGRQNVTIITSSKAEGGTVECYVGINSFHIGEENITLYHSPEKHIIDTSTFTWKSRDNKQIAPTIYIGDWTKGTVASKNEGYTYNGGTWLCIADKTTDEPSEQSHDWRIYAAKGGSGLRVEGFSSAGSAAFTEGQTDWRATFELHVWENDIETTDTLPTTRFRWTRVSEYSAGDTAWNGAHENIGDTLSVTYDDLKGDTSFICAFLSADGNDVLASRTF